MERVIVTPSQLQLRDTVRMFHRSESEQSEHPWSTCVVVAIRDGQVTLFRPYAITSDFDCGGKVIGYTGVESYQIAINDTRLEYVLIERTKAPR